MEDILQAIILGIVQGITEFLPVSSSGHLILVPALFGWDDKGLAFDVGLHLGTLLALLLYFWRDWYLMFRSFFADLAARGTDVPAYRFESKLLLLLALGCIPIAIVGLLLEDVIEEKLRDPAIVIFTLAVVGAILILVEYAFRKQRTIRDITWRDALIIGTAQCFALIPGVSRSGSTIIAGLWRDLDRTSATRFSFLLGTPAFFGAGILKSRDLLDADSIAADEMLVGFAVSAIVGIAAIWALLRFVRNNSLAVFGWYRLAVAAFAIVVAVIRTA